MMKLGIKAVVIGFILTACINFIYTIDKLGINIALNIILIVLSCALLLVDEKNNNKFFDEKNQKDLEFKNNLLTAIKDKAQLIKIVDKLESLNVKSDKVIDIMSTTDIKVGSLIEKNNLNFSNVESAINNMNMNLDNTIKISIKTNEEVLNANKASIIEELKVLIEVNNRIYDENMKLKETILSISQDLKIGADRKVENICTSIEKIETNLNDNKHLVNLVKLNTKVEKLISNIDEQVDANFEQIATDLQSLNNEFIAHKKKNNTSLTDILEVLDGLTNILEGQQKSYGEINNNVLAKLKSITEVSSRNVNLIKDSYNTLDKIVNDIA